MQGLVLNARFYYTMQFQQSVYYREQWKYVLCSFLIPYNSIHHTYSGHHSESECLNDIRMLVVMLSVFVLFLGCVKNTKQYNGWDFKSDFFILTHFFEIILHLVICLITCSFEYCSLQVLNPHPNPPPARPPWTPLAGDPLNPPQSTKSASPPHLTTKRKW